MPRIGSFDKNYPALQKRVSAHSRFGNAELNDWIFSCTNIEPKDHVLDLGCGFGKQTIPLIKNGCTVTAVDASADSLADLKSSIVSKRLKVVQSNFDELDLGHGSTFDKVISSYAFYYCNKPSLLLDKIKNAMNSGGLLFICGPSAQNNLEMKNFLKKIGVDFGEGSAPFMESEAPELFEKKFGNVKIFSFENVLKFPGPDAVWDYWSSHNMFDPSIEARFKEKIKNHFDANNIFTTTKVVRGILSKLT